MTALLPCPFCGGGETRIRENRHGPTMSGNGGLISVEITHWCPAVPGQPSRNTVTRTGRDHASALAAWNRRAPVPGYAAGAEAMREAAAGAARAFPARTHGALATAPYAAAEQSADEIEAAIRALPIPEEPK